MEQTLAAAIAAWQESGAHGSIQERLERSRRWAPYWRDMAFKQMKAPAAVDAEALKLVDDMRATDILHGDDTVLDIGAGTGRYALAFAARCRGVVALDAGEAPLTVIARNSAALHMDNITCVQAEWEQFQPEATYDLVFSSMCPAICDYRELMRMEAMSGRVCALITVRRGSYDLHRRELMRLCDVHPRGGMATEALRYVEVLYLAGRDIHMKSWSSHCEVQRDPEEYFATMRDYLAIFGVSPRDSEPVMRAYFDGKIRDGVLPDESQLNLALLWWHVPQ